MYNRNLGHCGAKKNLQFSIEIKKFFPASLFLASGPEGAKAELLH
jgi:hypothetical protein